MNLYPSFISADQCEHWSTLRFRVGADANRCRCIRHRSLQRGIADSSRCRHTNSAATMLVLVMPIIGRHRSNNLILYIFFSYNIINVFLLYPTR